MVDRLQGLVAEALTNVRNPRHDKDVLSAGMVEDLVVGSDGAISLKFLLGREDPATLVREVRRALLGVDGVTDVKIDVAEPAAGDAGPQSAGPAPGTRPVQPPAPVEIQNLGVVIAVSSGKGGVGKSTVSANLAVHLARAGHQVGIMDADIYGPNIPRLFGADEKPAVREGKIVPIERHGVKLISLGFLVERDMPAIWRGPIVTKIINQFLRDVDWGRLDYFIIDLPPGTGDAQLSLAQAIHLRGGIIVTTPQEMAVGDALRGAKMFEKVGVPVLGIIENMSYFECPHCSERTEIFFAGGGERLARELDVALLGQVPLQAGMADLADRGQPVVVAEPESPAAKALAEAAQAVVERAGGKTVSLPIVTG